MVASVAILGDQELAIVREDDIFCVQERARLRISETREMQFCDHFSERDIERAPDGTRSFL